MSHPLAAGLEKPTPTRIVNAGPLSAEYEQGELRYVRFGKREVIRRVYVAVRDRNWQTIPIHVQENIFESTQDSFRIELEARHESDGIVFDWQGRLTGRADGAIRLEMLGEPRTEFLRNRIGICVLHPMETCAGQPCEVEHTDGTLETSRFPELVEPHQPFLNLRGLSYPVAPGVRAELQLSGDEFETEDQRNWSDYTFKTYSTRLSIPFPVRVKPGDRVHQSVELKLTGHGAAKPASWQAAAPVEITIHPETSPFPKVGIVYDQGLPSMGNHTRVDLAFADPKWPQRLRAGAKWRVPLEIACFTDDPELDFQRLKKELKDIGSPVARYLLFRASGPLTDPKAISIARTVFGPSAVIAAGSRGNFAELNRSRKIVTASDEVVWPVDPYIHANDYRTIVENLQGQMDPPRTARSFSGARSLIVSAVRVPDIATRAGWLAVSLKHLSSQGVASITYDLRGEAVPEIGSYLGNEVVRSTSSHPLIADALVIKQATNRGMAMTAFLANFSNGPVEVQVGGLSLRLAPLEMNTLSLS